MKKLLTTVALAALAASPAFAASHKRTAKPVLAPGYNAYASSLDRDTVVVNGNIVGRDPDSGIRLQLLRDADSQEYSAAAAAPNGARPMTGPCLLL